MKNLGKRLMAIASIACMLVSGCGTKPSEEKKYNLFDTDYVHTIDVRIDEEDWQDLLEHPELKTKYKADVVIDGETVEDVSFAAKGNSSLAFVKYRSDIPRYSFKIIFGKFIEGQTFHGLDRLNLNSNFADVSYMKEYLAYELFRQMDVPAPLCTFVNVTINGKDHGLYMAVEEESQSFLNRYSKEDGTLYKPEFDEPALDEERVRAIFSGVPMQVHGVKGSDLVYVNDDPSTYPDIFDNVVTEQNAESEERVIRALKTLQEGTDIDSFWDTDEIINYFAVHNFLMNYDSYTGMMLHNYYMYDDGSKLQIWPWDYNLSFGSFPLDGVFGHDNDPMIVVNKGIDTPLVATDEASRPLWNMIVSNETYLEKYHQAMDQLISKQFESGTVLKELDRVHSLIAPYIKTDATSFYTYEQTEKAFAILKELSLLRAQSIRDQLDGKLARDTDKQKAEEESMPP